VHVFSRSAGAFVEFHRLQVPGTDNLGTAVALDLPLLAAGGRFGTGVSVFRQGPAVDLAVSQTAPASAVPGEPIVLSVRVDNLGALAVAGASVADAFPAVLTDATWTCAATPGSSCATAGVGSIFDTVQLAAAGSITYTISATLDPAAKTEIVHTVTVSAPPGIGELDLFNNTSTGVVAVTPRADLSIDKTDGRLRVAPGTALSYTLTVHNPGPSLTRALVSDAFPAAYTSPTWTCSAPPGSLCQVGSGTGNLAAAAVTVQPGHSATYVTNGVVSPTATGTLANTATVAPGAGVVDPVSTNNADTDLDLVGLTALELTPGSAIARTFSPDSPDPHHYWLSQRPYASYEIVADAASGDVGPPLQLVRLAADASTVLQSAAGVSVLGHVRSLAFRNDRSVTVDHELIRVGSGGCSTDCGTDDGYRLRIHETTGRIPRFNQTGSQVTVVLLQNTTSAPLAGTVHFWAASGALLERADFALGARESVAVSTSSLPLLAGTSGSVTVSHDGPYGALAGKGVALEIATGFSFDAPMVSVPR
jgi:hypothetical protein